MMPTRSQRGQVLPIVTLAMVLVLGTAGIAVDMGYLRYERRLMQNAADSAAVAAAAELNYGDYVSAGQTDASTNGFTDGVKGVSVTVNNPPSEGYYAGQTNAAEVVISESIPTFFMKAVGIPTVTVSTRAVGRLGADSACIFALNTSASNTIRINGSGAISVQCGIVDDSSASQALLKNGSGILSATSIGVTGGYTENGSGSISPTPVTGVPPISDPLSYLSAPGVGSCTHSSKVSYTGSGSYTANPGVYCGGLTTSGSLNLTLNPGLYVIRGGSLTFNGSGTITGTGVTFYITSGASVTLNGSNTVKLTAPTSGTYAAMLFYQDKSDSAGATFNGSNTSAFTGALYFPAAQLTYNGSGPLAAYSILVANTIVFNGNFNINDDYSSLPGGSPIKTTVLAE